MSTQYICPECGEPVRNDDQSCPECSVAGSGEDVVLDAGMEIEDGLAWLQGGNILIDGSDAPGWMHRISGWAVEEAAEAIRQNAEMSQPEGQ